LIINKEKLNLNNNSSIFVGNSYKKYLNPSFIEPVKMDSYPLNLNNSGLSESSLFLVANN
jgi:hypothetical protein